MVLSLNLAMTPSEIAAASTLPAKIAWMSCHFSTSGTGLSHLPEAVPKGSILILDDSIPCSGHSADEITQILGTLVSRFSCSSLLLDFQRPHNEASAIIAAKLVSALPCPVVVTPAYAHRLSCGVFLPPAPLHTPLPTYLKPWAGREIWLEAALCREVITVTKKGTTYAPTDTQEKTSAGFFDEGLCCRYVTRVQKERVTFALFDTPQTLEKKLDFAHALGVTRAVGLYQELGAYFA